MLYQFSFQNFKSYRSETTIDFQANELPEFQDSLLSATPESTNALPLGVVYGPNGGGKSNLLQAFCCMVSTVVSPIRDLRKNRITSIFQQTSSAIPFSFDTNSFNCPTEFVVYFYKNGNDYRYYLSILHDVVISESLERRKCGARRSAMIFDRDEGEIHLGASIRSKHINTDINEKMPFLSFLAINYNIPVIAEVQEWFESCIIANYANHNTDSQILYPKNDNLKKDMINLLNHVDIDITDYRIDEANNRIYTQRIIDGNQYELPLEYESDGTTKLLCLLPLIVVALAEGRLIVLDEFDAKLHPNLLRYIIMLFRNPEINQHHAQLLFTAHDISIMKNTVFRRDEIWFASENDQHESELYSLYDIRQENNNRVNHTAAYYKQYLEGRYGADPYLRNILDGGDWA